MESQTYFAVPQNIEYGKPYGIKKFEGENAEEKLKTFLRNLQPSDKFTIIKGEEIVFKKRIEVDLTVKEVRHKDGQGK